MRTHTKAMHVEGHATCPFCELAAVSSAELLIHVNQAHLDFLTPEAELMAFIDEDNSPLESNNTMSNGRSYSPDDWGACGGVNNINLATNIVVNGGGEISPRSSHPQGSPLRNNLALKLKSPISTLQCPMCPHSSNSPSRLQEHVNREHFDLTSPSVAPTQQNSSNHHDANLPICPLCTQSFDTVSDLELHVNIEHKDILSPASPAINICPVCSVELEAEVAAKHIEAHFPVPSSGNDASGSTHVDREARKVQEQREFEMLRAQYGMDNQGNFREQSVTNMQRAVYAGEMSVSDYYERQLDLRAAESCGVDDGSSVTRGIVGRIRAVSLNSPQVNRVYTCTCVDHYAASYGDRGWGCGYRNTQMLISSLLTHTGYNELLYRAWQGQKPSRSAVPSISRLQSLIEAAWAQGFDLQGSEQLGCKLYNTRKWIGATEVVTLLSSLRIKCQLVDFHKPTGPEGSHPELFLWVLRYFQNGGDFIPPLYLQHQGHSRTVMGVEQFRDGSISILVLDPSHSPYQMSQLADTSTAPATLRLIRKSEAAMKARQYQVVAVIGTIDTEMQFQQSKVLRGSRIPQDR